MYIYICIYIIYIHKIYRGIHIEREGEKEREIIHVYVCMYAYIYIYTLCVHPLHIGP